MRRLFLESRRRENPSCVTQHLEVTVASPGDSGDLLLAHHSRQALESLEYRKWAGVDRQSEGEPLGHLRARMPQLFDFDFNDRGKGDVIGKRYRHHICAGLAPLLLQPQLQQLLSSFTRREAH